MGFTSQSGTLTTENYTYANGHLTEVKLNGTTSIFKQKAEYYITGQPSQIETGCLTRSYAYTNYGMPNARVLSQGSTTRHVVSYIFNAATGNLTSRQYPLVNKSESFAYDNLHRLTSFGGTNVNYDSNGNITLKGDVGSFDYSTSGKPFAVSEVTLSSSLSAGTQNVSYTSFDRPSLLNDNGYTATFTYNGNYDRVKMALLHNSSSALTRYYLGGCYEQDVKPTGTTEKLYLYGDYYTAPAVLIKQGGTSNVYYIIRDHLGSITHVMNASGTLIQELGYDAWGRMRNPSTLSVYAPANEPEPFLGRGYCGHEHLTGMGLINMNARLYDPLLGRFLAPDPYVQMPESSQSFNRYSYCMNNPLVIVDKDGKLWFIPILVGAAIGAAFSAATYTAMVAFTKMEWSKSAFWSAVGMGALGGALGGASGLLGSALGASQIGNSIGYNLLSQTTSTLITNATFGVKTDISDILGIVVGAGVGSLLPKYKAIKAKPIVNTLAETGYNTVRGAITGLAKGGVDAIIKKDARYLYMDAIGGAIAGGVKTLVNNAIFGAPFVRKEEFGIKGYHRTGGVSSLLNLGGGLTMGDNAWVNKQSNLDASNHEDFHMLQQGYKGGWAGFYGRIVAEFLYSLSVGKSVYRIDGTLENRANIYEEFRYIGRNSW